LTNQYAIYIPALVLQAANNYGIWNGSTTVWAPSSSTLASSSAQIAVISTLSTLNNTSGGQLTLGVTTPIIGATVADGQFAYIRNASANSVTLQDSAKLSGSGLRLFNMESVILGQYQSIPVIWNATDSKWVQVGNTGIVPDGRVNVITQSFGITGLRFYG